MKSKKNLLEQLKTLPYFNKTTISQLGKKYELTDTTVDTYISRFLKHKELIQLKKGLYVSTDFFNKNKENFSYSFYLANILRTPSYISSWTALQYYNLATETIHTITSVTLKTTRAFETKAGNFTYQSINKELFSDFSSQKGSSGKFDFFIASPSKALFDLIYFKTHQFRGVRLENISKLVEELRIDIDEMNKTEREKFFTMVRKYLHHE
jgi:predicted transcriptional regulator of viral defense system